MTPLGPNVTPDPTAQPDTNPLTRLWNRIPSHPGITLLSVALAVVSVVVGWKSLASVEPTYYVSSVETIARKASPHLSMRWDNEPIESLCVCRVAFWNEGNVPITQDRLPSSDPLRIVASSSVKILSTEAVNASRATLGMNYKLSDDRSQVMLSLRGGDALEHLDGTSVRLLFTGACRSTEFSVRGRVIGSTTIKKGLSPGTGPGSPVLGALWSAFVIGILAYGFFLRARFNEAPTGFQVAYLCIVVIGSIVFIAYLAHNFSPHTPDWFGD